MKDRIKDMVRESLEVYFGKRVTRASAALSYYLTLSIFPFLICISAIVKTFNITEADLVSAASGFLPETTLETISIYLEYVSQNLSPVLIIAAIGLMVTTSGAAFRGILNTMEEITGESRYSGFVRWLLSFVVSFLFLVAVYISGLVIIGGRWVFNFISSFGKGFGVVAEIWDKTRFVLLFLIIYLMVFMIHFMSVPRGSKNTGLGIGAFVSAISLVIVSIAFSAIISASSRYTLVYGSLTSIIIMMLWFYMLGRVLIMGSAVNNIVRRNRFEHNPDLALGRKRKRKKADSITDRNEQNSSDESAVIEQNE